MNKTNTIGLFLFIGLILLATIIGKLFSRMMFSQWTKLAFEFPGNPISTEIKLVGLVIISENSNLRCTAKLTTTDDALDIRMPLSGLPQIQIPRNSIKNCLDQSVGPFRSVDINLKNSVTIRVKGRGAKLIRTWWDTKIG
jgi:hypothetical protein